MDRTLSLRRLAEHIIIIISLGIMIFLPRMVAGWWYLDRASMDAARGSYLEASRNYEDAAARLWWRSGLFEQAAQLAWQAGDTPGALRLFERTLCRFQRTIKRA